MKYHPYWQRIFFLAIIFNLILFLGGASNFSAGEIKEIPIEDLPEIEWIETENTVPNESAPATSAVETFPEIILPPLEIPHTVFEPLPKLDLNPPPVKIENKIPENPPEEKIEPPPNDEKISDPAEKLKVIAKVYPKDIIEQFTASGAIKNKITLNEEKIILSVTITKEGKVRNAEIISGGTNDPSDMISLIAKTAVQSWIFEPYLDENGNPQELKTQIEFSQKDF